MAPNNIQYFGIGWKDYISSLKLPSINTCLVARLTAMISVANEYDAIYGVSDKKEGIVILTDTCKYKNAGKEKFYI